MLNVNFPITAGTQMETKAITVDARPVVEETCYGGIEWQGSIPINGMDFKYNRGMLWEHAAGGLSFYRSDFAAFMRWHVLPRGDAHGCAGCVWRYRESTAPAS